MEFSKRKLPKEAAENLRTCPIDTIEPFALMLAPVYAFMKMNEKFVAVKAPLDFFTREELEKLRTFESLHIPPFIESVLPFRSAARAVQALLSWNPEGLPPPNYELSDAVLRIIAPLWGPKTAIEPFFVSVFVNELCELLPPEALLSTRERSIDAYEAAVFGSSWAVFLALHLGFSDLPFLNQLRRRAFEAIGRGTALSALEAYNPLIEVLAAARETVPDHQTRIIDSKLFLARADRVSRKLKSRFKRMGEILAAREEGPPLLVATIYGERGFVDV